MCDCGGCYAFYVISNVVWWFHIHFCIFSVFVVVLVVLNDLHGYLDVCYLTNIFYPC